MSSQIPLTCTVPEAWLEAIDDYAQAQGLSRSDVLKGAIAHLLDLEDSPDWSEHFARLEAHLGKLSKQVHVLHKRLRTVEQEQTTPSLSAMPESPALSAAAASVTPMVPSLIASPAEAIEMIEGELLAHDVASQVVPDEKPPFGAIKLEELCRLNRINPLAIRSKADTVGLSLAEAIELETGWKYDPQTKTYAPPI